MVGLFLILALQEAPRPAGCDSTLLDGPVPTPVSAPPAIQDRLRAFEAIDRAAESIGGVPGGAEALVWFLIDVEGRVVRARIARSTEQEAVDSAAIRAARSFRFMPAERNGKPVCVWIRLPLRFPDRSTRYKVRTGRSPVDYVERPSLSGRPLPYGPG